MITLSLNNPVSLQQQLAEGLANEKPQAAQDGTKIYEVAELSQRFLILKSTHLPSATKPAQDKHSDWAATLSGLAGLAGSVYANKNPGGADGCYEFMSFVMQNVYGAPGEMKGPVTAENLEAFAQTVDANLKHFPPAKQATVSQIQEEIEAVQRLTEQEAVQRPTAQEAKPVKMAFTIRPSSNEYVSPQIAEGLQNAKLKADPTNEKPEIDKNLRPNTPISIQRNSDSSLEISIKTAETAKNASGENSSTKNHLAGFIGDTLANVRSPYASRLSVGESIALIEKVLQNSLGPDLKDSGPLTLGDLSRFARELDSEIWARDNGLQGVENEPRDPTLIFDPQYPVDHENIENIALSHRVLSGARDAEAKQRAAEQPLFELIADDGNDDEDGVFV